MAIGRHPALTPEEPGPPHDEILANYEFIQARVADGTYDSADVMVGGGRLIIANAESEDAFRLSLTTPPDHHLRSWEITQLLDFGEVMRTYLSE